ncbi:hypothetical protein P280DRAFT_478423 [Massarina eburnea CBS 473.64]|uniref:BTB domain-containing protein n=1 Tax=Massarina eburnea CBS 473.64 TaxID=1395130 RepID=A0A6A6S5C9_9PLEO|nr:hypothetical protein P280DRAFT_478423 [Massarina eburnea CBS 473.64]
MVAPTASTQYGGAVPGKKLPTRAGTVTSSNNVLKIEVVADGDFLIQLTPEAKAPLAEKVGNAQPNPKRARIVQFHVSKAVLIKCSPYFQQLLRTRPDLPSAVFENKGIGFGYAVEVWLRAIHNGCSSFPPNLKATHTERAWVAIGVGEQFGFAPKYLYKIKPWFVECYDHAMSSGPGLSPMTACCLAFPCSVFDHAEGFMKLTKYLAYNTNGNIFSHNPSGFHQLNSDARILDGPLTNARAHIQSVLDRELFFPLKKLFGATCDCRKETAFDYQEALMELDCWPVDKAVAKYPLQDIIDELEKFTFTPKAEACTSGICNHNFYNSVQIAIKKTKAAFDGLCLDCMERSQSDELPRQEFIAQNAPYKGCFDMGCRFGHGRTSWYFSWMGSLAVRRDILTQYRLEKTAGMRGRRGKRGGRRTAIWEGTTNEDHQAQKPSRTAGSSDKEPENATEYDDDDEFFDAEDDNTNMDHVNSDIHGSDYNSHE